MIKLVAKIAVVAALVGLWAAPAARAQYVPGGACAAHQWIDAYGLSTGLVCAQPGAADLSDTTAPTTFAPTDQSGASLIFTSVSVRYYRLGNLVFVYGTFTYPTTANSSSNSISLPVAVPNQSYAQTPGVLIGETGGANPMVLLPVKNTSTAHFVSALTGAIVANSSLSTQALSFMLIYPAS